MRQEPHLLLLEPRPCLLVAPPPRPCRRVRALVQVTATGSQVASASRSPCGVSARPIPPPAARGTPGTALPRLPRARRMESKPLTAFGPPGIACFSQRGCPAVLTGSPLLSLRVCLCLGPLLSCVCSPSPRKSSRPLVRPPRSTMDRNRFMSLEDLVCTNNASCLLPLQLSVQMSPHLLLYCDPLEAGIIFEEP